MRNMLATALTLVLAATAAAATPENTPSRSPEAHAAFLAEHADALANAKAALTLGEPLSGDQETLLSTLDTLAGQKDAAWSGLYWHTDLEEALSRARDESKLVLSLRMLGNLTDNLSCANSRLFRAILYTDPAVAELLNERFVLHWSPQRPVPKVTIDFGDGRTLYTTVTGNSMHLVLDPTKTTPDQQIIDILPGLYAPKVFAEMLTQIEEQRTPVRHPTAQASIAEAERLNPRPTAEQAAATTISKLGMEMGFIDQITTWRTPTGEVTVTQPVYLAAQQYLEQRFDLPTDQSGESEVRLHPLNNFGSSHSDVDLSDNALNLIRAQNPTLTDRQRYQLHDNLRNTLALDTALNEIELHPQCLDILDRIRSAKDTGGPTFEYNDIYAVIYDRVFLTPNNDPYLGLKRDTTYDALWHNEPTP